MHNWRLLVTTVSFVFGVIVADVSTEHHHEQFGSKDEIHDQQ